jgi:hypothetical protein
VLLLGCVVVGVGCVCQMYGATRLPPKPTSKQREGAEEKGGGERDVDGNSLSAREQVGSVGGHCRFCKPS